MAARNDVKVVNNGGVIPQTDTGNRVQVVCYQRVTERAIFSRRPFSLQFRERAEIKKYPKKGGLKDRLFESYAGYPPGSSPQNDDWPSPNCGSGLVALYLVQNIAVTASSGREGVR
jgi:hypothetical protein